MDGKTRSKAILLEKVEETFEQIEAFHRFQDLVREYTEVNIKICDVQLEAGKEASMKAEKKG